MENNHSTNSLIFFIIIKEPNNDDNAGQFSVENNYSTRSFLIKHRAIMEQPALPLPEEEPEEEETINEVGFPCKIFTQPTFSF